MGGGEGDPPACGPRQGERLAARHARFGQKQLERGLRYRGAHAGQVSELAHERGGRDAEVTREAAERERQGPVPSDDLAPAGNGGRRQVSVVVAALAVPAVGDGGRKEGGGVHRPYVSLVTIGPQGVHRSKGPWLRPTAVPGGYAPPMPAIHLVTELPGPKSRALVARREAAMPSGAAKLTGLAIAHAQGATMTDVDGNTVLDFAGGIGMLAVGHTPENVVAALQKQAAEVVHMCSIIATHESSVLLAERLNALAPGPAPKRTALMNSGAEALETAVHICRASTKRQGVVVFEGAYHGRTNLTLAMTSKFNLFKKGFGPFAPEVYRLPFPTMYRRPPATTEAEWIDWHCAQLDHSFTAYVDPSHVACVVVEPVQGEGGFLPAPAPWLRKLRALCDQHGMLLVADEVQCGMGRTGKLWACEHSGVVPDVITTAKSLGAGMPISAIVGRADVMDAPHPGGLGGTYSGSPMACVAALAALDTITDPRFLARANVLAARIRGRLDALQARFPRLVGDVRGLGPMLAIELVKDPVTKEPWLEATQAVNAETLTRGLVTIRAGLYSNCVRLLPPLNLTDAEIDEGMGVLEASVAAVAARLGAA